MRSLASALALCLTIAAPSRAAADDAREERGTLRRTLREYLFLDATFGGRYRRAVYAEDVAPGPEDRGELRVTVNGSWRDATGPLGAYVGIALAGRVPEHITGADPDPFSDPLDRDRLALGRNIRLFGAHAEYVVKDEDRRERAALRLGRLSDLDDRAQLVIYDGGSGRLALSRSITVGIFGGRRAYLDRGFPNQREDAPIELVGGASFDLRSDAFSSELSYRFEEVHRPALRVGFDVNDSTMIDLEVSALISKAAPSLVAGESDEGGTAMIARTGGDFRSAGLETALAWSFEAQLGTDPRSFGRSGLLRSEDIAASTQVPFSEARIDRLFLGPEGSNVRGEISFEHWLAKTFGLTGGVFARVPLGSDAQDSLHPQVIELWAGPELSTWDSNRAGLEVRYAIQDPGPVGRLFGRTGDGVRSWGTIRLFGEIGARLNEELRLAVRPEVEVSTRNTEGPLSRTENLYGFAGGALATIASSSGFDAAARYGIESLPTFDNEGVELVHAVELWIGGSY
jgi:hypothetical protein